MASSYPAPPQTPQLLPPPQAWTEEEEEACQERYEVARKESNDACEYDDLEKLEKAWRGLTQSFKEKDDDRNLLYVAARAGSVQIVSFLLKNGKDLNLNTTAWEAVRGAKKSGNVKAMISTFDLLFRHGLDLQDCKSILHVVTENVPILEYLLSKWADPNSFDAYGITVLGKTNNDVSLKLLVDNGADISREILLHKAVWYGRIEDENWRERMEFLVDVLGVDINAPAVFSGEGRVQPTSRNYPWWMKPKGKRGTALHWAVRGFGSRRARRDLRPKVKWLLEKGADANVLDDEGLRPVDYAEDQDMRDLFDFNRDAGAQEEQV